MAVTTYYPNDAGSGGHDGAPFNVSSLPGALATWVALAAMNGGEKNNISDDNGSTHDVGNVGPPEFNGGGICAVYAVSETPTQLDVTVKMKDGGGEPTQIWIYDHNGSAFVSKGTHGGGAPGDYTFSFSINTNPGYYKSGGGEVHVLVASTHNAGTSCEVYDMKLDVTYSAGGSGVARRLVGGSLADAPRIGRLAA